MTGEENHGASQRTNSQTSALLSFFVVTLAVGSLLGVAEKRIEEPLSAQILKSQLYGHFL